MQTHHTICAEMERLLWSHHHEQYVTSEAAWVLIPFRLINCNTQIHQVRMKHLAHVKINGECDWSEETTQQRLLHLVERLCSLVLKNSGHINRKINRNWMVCIRIILEIYFKLPSLQGTLRYFRKSHMVLLPSEWWSWFHPPGCSWVWNTHGLNEESKQKRMVGERSDYLINFRCKSTASFKRWSIIISKFERSRSSRFLRWTRSIYLGLGDSPFMLLDRRSTWPKSDFISSRQASEYIMNPINRLGTVQNVTVAHNTIIDSNSATNANRDVVSISNGVLRKEPELVIQNNSNEKGSKYPIKLPNREEEKPRIKCIISQAPMIRRNNEGRQRNHRDRNIAKIDNFHDEIDSKFGSCVNHFILHFVRP